MCVLLVNVLSCYVCYKITFVCTDAAGWMLIVTKITYIFVCVKKHCLCNLLILIVMLHAFWGFVSDEFVKWCLCYLLLCHQGKRKILQNGSICKLIQKFVFQRRHENIDGWSGCSWKNNHSVQAQTGRDCDNYSHNRLVQNVQVSWCHLIVFVYFSYWAIQAGLLTPLTFAQHYLSPLAAFTSRVTLNLQILHCQH